MKLYATPIDFGIVVVNVPELTPAGTLTVHDAVFFPCANNPIQSPLIDLDADVHVPVSVVPMIVELGRFDNVTAKKVLLDKQRSV